MRPFPSWTGWDCVPKYLKIFYPHYYKAELLNIGPLLVHRLCFFTSGSCIILIWLSRMLTKLSFPHLGQYRRKFSIMVSGLTLILVFPEHTGHRTHCVPSLCTNFSLSIVLLSPFSPLVKALIQKVKRTNPAGFVLLTLMFHAYRFITRPYFPAANMECRNSD